MRTRSCYLQKVDCLSLLLPLRYRLMLLCKVAVYAYNLDGSMNMEVDVIGMRQLIILVVHMKAMGIPTTTVMASQPMRHAVPVAA